MIMVSPFEHLITVVTISPRVKPLFAFMLSWPNFSFANKLSPRDLVAVEVKVAKRFPLSILRQLAIGPIPCVG